MTTKRSHEMEREVTKMDSNIPRNLAYGVLIRFSTDEIFKNLQQKRRLHIQTQTPRSIFKATTNKVITTKTTTTVIYWHFGNRYVYISVIPRRKKKKDELMKSTTSQKFGTTLK